MPPAQSTPSTPDVPPPYDWQSRLTAAAAGREAGAPEAPRPDWQRLPYPFVTGQPDVREFPARAWARALRDTLLPQHIHESLDDRGAADDPLLVRTLCRDVLPARGITATPDQVLITMGSRHGLRLLAEALLSPGATVAMEEPGSQEARRCFRASGASILPLSVDEDGVRPPESFAGVDVLYLTPNHHNPTNVTLSDERRRALLTRLAGHDTIVIEHDSDSELRYLGESTPALQSLDTSGRIVHLGSFSEFLAPGLRLGYLVADAQVVTELRERRGSGLVHPPGQLQRALALLIGSGEYQRVVLRHCLRMRRRWEEISEAVAEHLAWTRPGPACGSSLWLRGPDGLDCRDVQIRALYRGVAIERGDVCFAAPAPPVNFFRLGFSVIPVERIRPGIRELAAVLA
jgi:GntR family transcriptional regulator/MocR family aminotransferase